MTPFYLIDSDAFYAIRTLGLLHDLCNRLPAERPLWMTGYVANIELCQLQTELTALKARGHLVVNDVVAKSAAGQRMRQLRKTGVDKGEAEAIAWSVETFQREGRPIFVSADGPARKHAKANHVVALDVMGAIVDWVEESLLDIATARKATVVWDDRSQERGRPGDYDGFDRTYAKRLDARNRRLGI